MKHWHEHAHSSGFEGVRIWRWVVACQGHLQLGVGLLRPKLLFLLFMN